MARLIMFCSDSECHEILSHGPDKDQPLSLDEYIVQQGWAITWHPMDGPKCSDGTNLLCPNHREGEPTAAYCQCDECRKGWREEANQALAGGREVPEGYQARPGDPVTTEDYIRELLNEARQLRPSSYPWKLEIGLSGENWFICGLGTGDDGKNYNVTTDHVHASDMDGDARGDAEFIVWARNRLSRLLGLVDALLDSAHEEGASNANGQGI